MLIPMERRFYSDRWCICLLGKLQEGLLCNYSERVNVHGTSRRLTNPRIGTENLEIYLSKQTIGHVLTMGTSCFEFPNMSDFTRWSLGLWDCLWNWPIPGNEHTRPGPPRWNLAAWWHFKMATWRRIVSPDRCVRRKNKHGRPMAQYNIWWIGQIGYWQLEKPSNERFGGRGEFSW